MHPTGNYQKIVARTSRVHGWSCWIPLSPDVFPHWGQNPLLTYWNWTRHVLHPEIYLSKTPKGIKSLEFKKCHWTKSRSFDVGPMSFDQGTSWVFSIRKTDTNCQVFFSLQASVSPLPRLCIHSQNGLGSEMWLKLCKDKEIAKTLLLGLDPRPGAVFQDHGGVCWKFI